MPRRWEGKRAGIAGDAPGLRVLLYEKNGLQHGGFAARTSGTATGMHWSPDSSLLALTVSEQLPEGCVGRVQVWARKNWHWYLKYERAYPGAHHVIACWDEERSDRLTLAASDGRLTSVQFALAPHISGACRLVVGPACV